MFLSTIKKYLCINGILSKAIGNADVIEFQKSDYGHCQLLLTLWKENTINSFEDIDAVILAEIFNLEQFPWFHQTVTRSMIPILSGCDNSFLPYLVNDRVPRDIPNLMRSSLMYKVAYTIVEETRGGLWLNLIVVMPLFILTIDMFFLINNICWKSITVISMLSMLPPLLPFHICSSMYKKILTTWIFTSDSSMNLAK